MFRLFVKHKSLLLYALALGVLLLLLNWLEWKFIISDRQLKLYSGIMALFFTGFGIWLSIKLREPKVKVEKITETVVETVYIEKEPAEPGPDSVIDEEQIQKLGISKRELEVLQLMATGLSNQEIADRLFVSSNTVKTHVAKIFEKLDAKRRTQAIEIAKQLRIII
jgi:DNA-binding CsgD family transcriptional regulator